MARNNYTFEKRQKELTREKNEGRKNAANTGKQIMNPGESERIQP